MPSARTECTELSLAFGILGVENFLEQDRDQIESCFEGTLSQNKYERFKSEFPQREALCTQMHNVGFGLRAIHSLFRGISSLRWAGPQPQAATTAVAKDLIVANTPVSVKENSNVVYNLSPYNLFEALPSGQAKARRSENWFVVQAPEAYQKLYSFIRNKGLNDLPGDVSDFERNIRREDRKPIKALINSFGSEDSQTFAQLYLDLCHEVARVSAKKFNDNISASLNGHSRNAVLEQIARHFFRMNAVEYILGGIDKGDEFAVIIPEMTRWKKDWAITDVIAEPELDKDQSRVRFTVHFKNKMSRDNYTAQFHAEIRWSHGKFQIKPEGKLYKNFAWEDIAFFKSIYGNEPIKRLKIIGEGSYGIVYEAFHKQRARKVAVKEFQIDFGTSDEERLRFEREINLLSQLDHPNILPIIDSDLSSNNLLWFAMPLAIANIADIIDELKNDLQRVNLIFTQVLSGMAYAHQQNIIHRDLKPQNILLFPEDKIMIGDFGLGKSLGYDASSVALTATDDQLGTFAYTAPEQMTSAASVDYRADIYSLGKTLLHMLVGGNPPMYAEQLIQQVDGRYTTFITRSIQKNPDDRFQSVNEMLESFVQIDN